MTPKINKQKNQVKKCLKQNNIDPLQEKSDFYLRKYYFYCFTYFVLHTDILTVFILKYYLIMELIDTPNPNAKKILVEHDYEIATYINQDSSNIEGVAKMLTEINGVVSIFTGPGFLTLTKEESADWKAINTDILNKFDTM